MTASKQAKMPARLVLTRMRPSS